MDYKDYYSILGISKTADAKTLKAAYRKLARKHHPDVNQSDTEADHKFKEIGEAYEVLKDPEKRDAYDLHGANWKNGPQQQSRQSRHSGGAARGGFGGGGFDFGGDFPGGGESSDFFESMFGGRRQGGGAGRSSFRQKGEDIDVSISIPLEDAYQGSSRTITFTTPEVSASGQVENKKKTLNVNIPKGVKKGGKIRLKGQGAAGLNGGPAGDMYIRLDIDKHRLFEIEGVDVFLTLPVAPWEAALGAKVKVPTPEGTLTMTVPKGVEGGKKMRLKGKGIPAAKAGDLYVEIRIVVPPAESDKAREIYKEMQELNFNPRPHFGV
jgi:curved DNA-binding protein